MQISIQKCGRLSDLTYGPLPRAFWHSCNDGFVYGSLAQSRSQNHELLQQSGHVSKNLMYGVVPSVAGGTVLAMRSKALALEALQQWICWWKRLLRLK